MQKNKFNVVTDGGWGSTGKGAVCTSLAHKFRPEVISTTNMPNAGHTAVYTDGRDFIAKAVPSAAALNVWEPDYNPLIVIGPSAAFHIPQMLKEIDSCNLHNQIVIHPRAGVVTDDHRQQESGTSESSTKHIASTMQGCGAFLADKVLRKPTLKLARDYPELDAFTTNHRFDFPISWKNPVTILHEGSQGFSLDINHGSHYPQCTSRGTTAIQNAADMGVSHLNMGDVYLVIRPYPIRVGNVIENGVKLGDSGGHYDDHEELEWSDVAREAGMPEDVATSLLKKELTTVTRRLRRVFSFSKRQLREAVLVNGATKIALNFANYIDWSCSGCDDHRKLPPKVMRFVEMVEEIAKIPVTWIGTGPRIDQVCFL